jgi:hypothetical protein
MAILAAPGVIAAIVKMLNIGLNFDFVDRVAADEALPAVVTLRCYQHCRDGGVQIAGTRVNKGLQLNDPLHAGGVGVTLYKRIVGVGRCLP